MIVSENCCLSGGAIGADTLWGTAAKSIDHQVIHFSFKGHKISRNPDVVVLPEAILATADQHCLKANEILKRKYPPRSRYVQSLLRRNWFQVESSKSLYAISHFERGLVAGGTSWAVLMFLRKFNFAACPAYVFDQELCHWYEWNGGFWQDIYEPPPPRDVWTGIGTRDIGFTGRLAINVLMRKENDLYAQH
jgi:hypothetical protein